MQDYNSHTQESEQVQKAINTKFQVQVQCMKPPSSDKNFYVRRCHVYKHAADTQNSSVN